MRIKLSLARISWSPLPGESWHLAVEIYDPDPVAVAS
jgi:phosphatidylethanolamine-binding protein (PEBP) family uncharacterized protein